MKKSFLMMLPLGVLMFASCNHGISAEEQALQQANDSLRQANAKYAITTKR